MLDDGNIVHYAFKYLDAFRLENEAPDKSDGFSAYAAFEIRTAIFVSIFLVLPSGGKICFACVFIKNTNLLEDFCATLCDMPLLQVRMRAVLVRGLTLLNVTLLSAACHPAGR